MTVADSELSFRPSVYIPPGIKQEDPEIKQEDYYIKQEGSSNQPIDVDKLYLDNLALDTAQNFTILLDHNSVGCHDHKHHKKLAGSLLRTIDVFSLNELGPLKGLVLDPNQFLTPFVEFRDRYLLNPKSKRAGLHKKSMVLEDLRPRILRELNGRTMKTYPLNENSGGLTLSVRLFSTSLKNTFNEDTGFFHGERYTEENLKELIGFLFKLVCHIRAEYAHGHGILMDAIEERKPSDWLRIKKEQNDDGMEDYDDSDNGLTSEDDSIYGTDLEELDSNESDGCELDDGPQSSALRGRPPGSTNKPKKAVNKINPIDYATLTELEKEEATAWFNHNPQEQARIRAKPKSAALRSYLSLIDKEHRKQEKATGKGRGGGRGRKASVDEVDMSRIDADDIRLLQTAFTDVNAPVIRQPRKAFNTPKIRAVADPAAERDLLENRPTKLGYMRAVGYDKQTTPTSQAASSVVETRPTSLAASTAVKTTSASRASSMEINTNAITTRAASMEIDPTPPRPAGNTAVKNTRTSTRKPGANIFGVPIHDLTSNVVEPSFPNPMFRDPVSRNARFMPGGDDPFVDKVVTSIETPVSANRSQGMGPFSPYDQRWIATRIRNSVSATPPVSQSDRSTHTLSKQPGSSSPGKRGASRLVRDVSMEDDDNDDLDMRPLNVPKLTRQPESPSQKKRAVSRLDLDASMDGADDTLGTRPLNDLKLQRQPKPSSPKKRGASPVECDSPMNEAPIFQINRPIKIPAPKLSRQPGSTSPTKPRAGQLGHDGRVNMDDDIPSDPLVDIPAPTPARKPEPSSPKKRRASPDTPVYGGSLTPNRSTASPAPASDVERSPTKKTRFRGGAAETQRPPSPEYVDNALQLLRMFQYTPGPAPRGRPFVGKEAVLVKRNDGNATSASASAPSEFGNHAMDDDNTVYSSASPEPGIYSMDDDNMPSASPEPGNHTMNAIVPASPEPINHMIHTPTSPELDHHPDHNPDDPFWEDDDPMDLDDEALAIQAHAAYINYDYEPGATGFDSPRSPSRASSSDDDHENDFGYNNTMHDLLSDDDDNDNDIGEPRYRARDTTDANHGINSSPDNFYTPREYSAPSPAPSDRNSVPLLSRQIGTLNIEPSSRHIQRLDFTRPGDGAVHFPADATWPVGKPTFPEPLGEGENDVFGFEREEERVARRRLETVEREREDGAVSGVDVVRVWPAAFGGIEKGMPGKRAGRKPGKK